MKDRRPILHKKLIKVFDTNNVYYQPSSSVQMTYPAIRYILDGNYIKRYDNKREIFKRRYTVTHIYKSTQDEKQEVALNAFENISFDRQIRIDGIYNDTYTIYF